MFSRCLRSMWQVAKKDLIQSGNACLYLESGSTADWLTLTVSVCCSCIFLLKSLLDCVYLIFLLTSPLDPVYVTIRLLHADILVQKASVCDAWASRVLCGLLYNASCMHTCTYWNKPRACICALFATKLMLAYGHSLLSTKQKMGD